MVHNDKKTKTNGTMDNAIVRRKFQLSYIKHRVAMWQEKRKKRNVSLTLHMERDNKYLPQGFFGLDATHAYDTAVKAVTEGVSPLVTKLETDVVKPALLEFSDIVKRAEETYREGVKDLDHNIGLRVSQLIVGTACCVAIYFAARYGAPKLITGVKLAIMATGKACGAFINSLFDDLTMKPQGDLDEKIGGLMATVVGLFCLDKFDAKSFLRSIANYRQRDNLTKLFTSLPELLNWCINAIKGWLTGCPVTYQASTGDTMVDAWLDRVKEVVIRHLQGDLKPVKQNQEYVASLIVSGKRAQYRHTSDNRNLDPIRAAIRMALKDLDDIMAEFDKSAFNKTSIRIAPMTILLKGKSGVGKSAMTVPLLDKIMLRTFATPMERSLYKENNMDFIYSRAAETEFWDGYYGQKAVVFDDFMQADETKVNNGLVNEAFDIIRASNIYPMLLHKAHLEDKGNSYLTSRIILCSTNNSELRTQVLNEPEALKRRFHISATIIPKTEYCTEETKHGTTDQRRLRSMEGFNTDVYEIHYNNEIISFDDFVDVCVEKYWDIERSGTKYLEEVSNLREDEFHDAMCPQDSLDIEKAFEQALGEVQVPEEISLIERKYNLLKTKVAECLSQCKEIVNNSLAKYPYLKWFALIITILATGLTLYTTWPGSWSLKGDSPQSYMNQKYVGKTNPKNFRMVIRNMKHQDGLVDKRKEDRIDRNFRSITSRNYYVVANCEDKIGSFILFTHDRWALMNRHIYDKLCVLPEFTLLNWGSLWGTNQSKGSRTYTGQEFSSFEVKTSDVDLVSVNFDGATSKLRQHKDIRKQILTDIDMKDFSDTPDCRIYLFTAGDSSVKSANVRTHKEFTSYSSFSKMPVFSYPLQTRDGHCGSLAFSTDPCNHYGKILFFHCAGNGSRGAGVVVPDCLVTKTKPPSLQPENVYPEIRFRPYLGQSGLEDIVGLDTVIDHELCGLPVIGAVDDPPHICRETKLRKSLLYNYKGEIKRAPAVLKPSNGKDPFYETLKKYSSPDPDVDVETLQVAAISYGNELCKLPAVDKSVLTFEQAVEGIQGRKFLNGIPRKTSAGYPYCNLYANGKKQIFGPEGAYQFDTPAAKKVRKDVDDKLKLLKSGKRPMFIYLDAMKDELRSKRKVQNMETRMISCCPLELTILTRMYFGNFAAFMMENRLQNGCAVGINPMSKEWSDLADLISGEDSQCVAGDFSGFDSSQSSVTTNLILDIINGWYNDGNDEIRGLLWAEVVNSVHLHGNLVIIFDHCLPSGHPLTSIINSMFVNVSFRYCWIKQTESLSSIDAFSDLVKLVAYGDDNISGIRPIAQTYGFDFRAIRYWMYTLGLAYTPENKLEDEYDYKSLEECTFLKRGFRKEDGVWYAPLDIDVVLEMPCWYRHGPEPLQRQADNIDNALRELSLHDSFTFDSYAEFILAAIRTYGRSLPIGSNLFPQSYYREKCFSSWVDEEFLEESDFVEAFPDIVSHPGSSQDDDNITVVGGFEPQSNLGPAEHKEIVRKDITSSVDHAQTGPTYDAVGSTVVNEREVNQTTGFLQDAEERNYQPFPIERITVDAMVPARANMDKSDVVKILETPVQIRTFSVASADARNATKISINLPFDPTNIGNGTDSGQGMWLSRLNAYQGFRGTAVIEFQTNVNRFAQGRLLCHYIPGQNDSVPTNESHRFNLMTKSQTPNVQINLNRDTSVCMRVPYVSAHPAYDLGRRGGTTLTSCDGQMGILYVVIYSPLVGATSVDVNVWLHFEDVELLNPTYSPQGDLKTKKNAADSEEPNGVLSGPLNVVSKAAGVISMIPSLSSYMGTAQWFLRASARAASAFGFAKPSSEAHLTRVIDQHNAYWLTGDGEVADFKTGWSCTNKVDCLPGFAGNDLDEMAVEYICNRNAFRGSFTWATSSVTGTELYSELVGPNNLTSNGTINTVTWRTFPPFALMCYLTYMWRADIVYTFKFVKTEFHTGRIAVNFRPGSTTSPTAIQAAYCPREILDLKESDTFTIIIPYCGLTPFLDFYTNLGTLSLRVINPLNAPASVANSIDVIVEISAQNVQFAGVSDRMASPVTGNNTAWRPQGDLVDVAPREKVIVLPGLSSEKGRNEAYRFVNGESILSIKQLLNRLCSTRYRSSVSTQKSVTVAPFKNGGALETTGVYSNAPFSYDYLSLFSSCYTLSRGSIRLAFSLRVGNDYVVNTYQSSSYTVQAYVSSANVTCVPQTCLPTQKDVNSGVVVLHLPHFAISHSRDNTIFFDNTSGTFGFSVPQTLCAFNSNTTFTTSDLSLYRSAGDDFQLGFFIGVPVLNTVETPLTTL